VKVEKALFKVVLVLDGIEGFADKDRASDS
jgi:hypothetical protein